MSNEQGSHEMPLLDQLKLAEGQELAELLREVPARLQFNAADATDLMMQTRQLLADKNQNPAVLGAAVLAYAAAADRVEPALILIPDIDQVLTLAAGHSDEAVRQNARAAMLNVSKIGGSRDIGDELMQQVKIDLAAGEPNAEEKLKLVRKFWHVLDYLEAAQGMSEPVPAPQPPFKPPVQEKSILARFTHNAGRLLTPLKEAATRPIVSINYAPAFQAALDNGNHIKAIRLLNDMDQQKQATVLTADEVVWRLARNGQAEAVITLLNGMDQEQQARVLTADHAAWGLADYGQDEAVITLFNDMDQQQQAEMLAVKGAVWGLANKGQSESVIKLLSGMDKPQQASVLAASGAVEGLANKGQSEAVIKLLNGMDQQQKAKVLTGDNAVLGLANNGQADVVIKLLNGMDQQQQAKVLTADHAVWGLANYGQHEAIDRIKASWRPLPSTSPWHCVLLWGARFRRSGPHHRSRSRSPSSSLSR